DRLARLLHLRAADLQADAQLQVGRHEGAFVALGDRLEVAEDRLDVARRGGGTGQLAIAEQRFPLAVQLHEAVSWSVVVGSSKSRGAVPRAPDRRKKQSLFSI